MNATRDALGNVLCCHGRPFSCSECGEDYAKELNASRPALAEGRTRDRIVREAAQQIGYAILRAGGNCTTASAKTMQALGGDIEAIVLDAIARVPPERPQPEGWQAIEKPPQHAGPHSLRLLGILADGSHVLCHYTPFYLGHADEAKGLWMCENYAWATKPTHWQPLPAPPSPQEPANVVDSLNTRDLHPRARRTRYRAGASAEEPPS